MPRLAAKKKAAAIRPHTISSPNRTGANRIPNAPARLDTPTTGTVSPTHVREINSDGMFNRVRFRSNDLHRINCFGYAIGINLEVSDDNLQHRRAFLQINNFTRMAAIALRHPNPVQRVCWMMRREIIKMGELNTPDGPMLLIRNGKPTKQNTLTGRFAKALVPTYYRIALFVALDEEHGGQHPDFHFAREYEKNKWTHKPGASPPTEMDTDGFPLNPKRSASAGRLRIGTYGPKYAFIGYMWVMSRASRIELSKRLKLMDEDALVDALENTA
jgi:hypothetical protein